MKIIKYSIAIAIAFLFIGCVQPTKEKQPLYVWNKYSSTSLEYGINDANKETLEKYKTEIKIIIDESENQNKRVAPGLYAEYGYLLFISSKPDEARQYFEKEVSIYPESKKFMKQFIEKLYGKSKG